ncbi:hypothetical protein AB3R30_03210 [Leptolyngbyaceae cyanobacterium UHCC 1019]
MNRKTNPNIRNSYIHFDVGVSSINSTYKNSNSPFFEPMAIALAHSKGRSRLKYPLSLKRDRFFWSIGMR